MRVFRQDDGQQARRSGGQFAPPAHCCDDRGQHPGTPVQCGARGRRPHVRRAAPLVTKRTQSKLWELVRLRTKTCTEAKWGATEARVTLRSDGTALAQCGLQDIGTGTYTIVAQTVSELTGLPLDKVEVELGSSSFPAGPVSGGSWATASAMSAIAGATREALKRIRQYATADSAAFAGTKPDALQVSNGTLSANGKSVTFADILTSQRLARAEGYFHSDGADMSKYSFRSFGVHFVEVRWDPGISRLRVARVVSAIDVGKVVNPLAARNQVEGGIVMGIGMAMFEAAEFDPRSGLPANNNYAEYVVPVHADQPEIDVILLDYPDYHLSEFGARGIGEIGVTGLAAAVANAVFHATGKRIRSLPITLDKLMDGIPATSV
nr:molybdopterin cofactor-binding domain-containing protein [Paraburkholderia fungorum]